VLHCWKKKYFRLQTYLDKSVGLDDPSSMEDLCATATKGIQTTLETDQAFSDFMRKIWNTARREEAPSTPPPVPLKSAEPAVHVRLPRRNYRFVRGMGQRKVMVAQLPPSSELPARKENEPLPPGAFHAAKL